MKHIETFDQSKIPAVEVVDATLAEKLASIDAGLMSMSAADRELKRNLASEY
jgi:hypothetical protein